MRPQGYALSGFGLHLFLRHAARRQAARQGLRRSRPAGSGACSCPAGSALIRYSRYPGCSSGLSQSIMLYHSGHCSEPVRSGMPADACCRSTSVRASYRVTRSSPGPCNSFTIFPSSNARADTRCLWKHNAKRAHLKFAK